jgi:hypothetical protein
MGTHLGFRIQRMCSLKWSPMKSHKFPVLLVVLSLTSCVTLDRRIEYATLTAATTPTIEYAHFETEHPVPALTAATTPTTEYAQSGTPAVPPSAIVWHDTQFATQFAVPPPTASTDAVWSSDGKRYATNECFVVDLEQGKMANVASGSSECSLMGFWGWTTNGRYAIFAFENHYNQKSTIVFDTQEWTCGIYAPGCGEADGSSNWFMRPCGALPVRISPNSELILTDKTVIDLQH